MPLITLCAGGLPLPVRLFTLQFWLRVSKTASHQVFIWILEVQVIDKQSAHLKSYNLYPLALI